MNDTEKVIAEIVRESLHAVVAERDKYRDALREIERVCVNEPDAVEAATRAADIARAALRDDTAAVPSGTPRCECSMRSGSTRTRPPICLDCGSEIALSVPSGDAEGEG